MANVSVIQVPLDLRTTLPVGNWLPDETIFSIASRHHIVACNRLDSDTCLQLFDNARAGGKHDVPSRLDAFVEKTGGKLGGVDEIVFKHTLLPFYFPLTSRQRTEEIIQAVRGTLKGSLRYPLYMLLNRFSGSHPLKACEACIDDDVKRFQVAYWHRIHQYPGVWVCPVHNRELCEVARYEQAAGSYGWLLPKKERLVGPSMQPELSGGTPDRFELMMSLAFCAISLAELAPEIFIEKKRAALTYRERLTALELRSRSGQLQLPRCITSILETAAPLRSILELSALPANDDQARAFVTRLCWVPVQNMHALWHLFAVVWLFRNWEFFWCSYQESLSKPVT
ncbi:TniQ family protein [Paraburkholderia bryophila]|uniref:TniQ family protein n=1 Tax=Paraburkholderia bryophila TaxID=420952 RepID=UPI00234B3B6D|nr:TniQ family protein [Paraburkholderia bryophila]WCM23630.1 TniQ family protein [Paraburkholderia bryophila]